MHFGGSANPELNLPSRNSSNISVRETGRNVTGWLQKITQTNGSLSGMNSRYWCRISAGNSSCLHRPSGEHSQSQSKIRHMRLAASSLLREAVDHLLALSSGKFAPIQVNRSVLAGKRRASCPGHGSLKALTIRPSSCHPVTSQADPGCWQCLFDNTSTLPDNEWGF